MELGIEILARFLAQQNVQITFPNLELNAREIVQLQCYQALRKIQEIVRDDTLEDGQCFERIERIVCTLEELGSDGGTRHDFG